MATGTPRLPLFVGAVIVLTLWPQPIASSSQSTNASYQEVIELYRRGDDALASKQLAILSDSRIRTGRNALLEAFKKANGGAAERAAAMIRAAAVLHTTTAFSARARDDIREFQYHFTFAEPYIAQLVSRERGVSPFVLMWRVFVMASYHEQMAVPQARDFGRHARDPRGDDARLLLALGATEEMGWSLRHLEDAPPAIDGDLKEAERDYRQALVLAPEFIEPRLRLGRVLVLQKDEQAAMVLRQIDDGIETPYQYLARLFEGDLYERAGDLTQAERQYHAAVVLMPHAQSAFMALAHVRHAQGARAQATQDVRVTTAATGVPDTADPWFWYGRGTAWRGPSYLEDLRKMIAP